MITTAVKWMLTRIRGGPAQSGLVAPASRHRAGRQGRFLLITGEDGSSWCEAARQLGAHVPIDAVQIGHLDGDLYDRRCTWLRHSQIASDGAVLARPDRFIAWRHPAGTTEPQAALSAALSQTLAGPAGAQAGVAAGLR